MPRFESLGDGIPGVLLEDLTGWLIVVEGTDGVGRTTHVNLLREYLERLGYAVAETGFTRSDLTSRGLQRAKQGNTLGSNAFNLYYATDFADRLEHQIVPALRAGFVMLTDRYFYSLMARAVVRGAEPEWIRQVYSFALKPDAVFYLRIDVPDLVPRVLTSGGFDYWESGMDIPMGDDLYDSFINYQSRVIQQLDRLSSDYDFDVIDATQSVEEIDEYLTQKVAALLQSTPARPAPRLATT
ncbi:MAG: thymidylate kinase [Candidatus Eisenbacteria bacterium]|uniref:Thymidylate kinase n=1 Tax=Eiseniibacteriota bacterium TaxID=2212470 RepID=A0A849SL81_UNCEI|nr:thymidylate kinase [Candidatus Eisenbacteria bacterium]